VANPYLGLTSDDLRQVRAGVAASIQVLHARACDLLVRESDPGQKVELLAAWERAYGLPDHCSPLNATIQDRQAALVARIASRGEQWIAHYVAVAAALGYTITITEFRQFGVGKSRVGDRCAAIRGATRATLTRF
jgi:uncharacterized protein YmfQ (DUF2313 family)